MAEPPFDQSIIESICKIIGDTSNGLTGSEIKTLLSVCRIEDIDPLNTKWKRLYNALVEYQNKNQTGNHIISFITETMTPVRYVGKDEWKFSWRRDELNKVLLFSGLFVNEQGKVARTKTATTIDEAKEWANLLKAELGKRNVHVEVLNICELRYLKCDFFYAVFEAMKGLADRFRKMTNCAFDTQRLYDHIFGDTRKGRPTPILAFNDMKTKTQLDEHYGIVSIIRGLSMSFRNPEAHEPEQYWIIEKDEALDIITMISYVHKRLDKAIDIRQFQTEEQILKSRISKN